MKSRLLILVLVSSLSACAGLGAMTIGAVIYYKSQGHEVATVNISANALKIYTFSLNQIEKNQALELVEKDDDKLFVSIKRGEIAASIELSALTDDVTKLVISSDTSPEESKKFVLDAVFKICNEFKVQCSQSDE